MTKTQLTSIGITMNSWLTLENKFFNIQLTNDGHLYPAPKTTQFYFDSLNELVYVRYTTGRLFKEKLQDDFVLVEFSFGNYYLHLDPGGVTDNRIGKFHEIYTFDSIVSAQ